MSACMRACKNVCACKQACEGLSFYSAPPGVQIQVVRFGNKHLSPLSHLTSPDVRFFSFDAPNMVPFCFVLYRSECVHSQIASLPVRIATRFSS